MLRNPVGEIPDDGACLGIAERMATVLQRDPLDASGKIGLPVLAFGGFFLGIGQIVPPAQLFQQYVIELGVAGRKLGALGKRAVLGQKIDAIALDAEIGAEAAASVHHMTGLVVQV